MKGPIHVTDEGLELRFAPEAPPVKLEWADLVRRPETLFLWCILGNLEEMNESLRALTKVARDAEQRAEKLEGATDLSKVMPTLLRQLEGLGIQLPPQLTQALQSHPALRG